MSRISHTRTRWTALRPYLAYLRAVAIVLVLGLVSVACEQMTDTSKSGSQPTLSAENAAPFALASGAMTQYIITALSNPGSLASAAPGGTSGSLQSLQVGPQSAAATIASCVSAVPKNATDNDNDGLPLQQTITFNCSGEFGELTLQGEGTLEITDKNDSDSGSGYTVTFDLEYRLGFSGELTSFSMAGSADVNSIGTNSFDGDFDFVYSFNIGYVDLSMDFDMAFAWETQGNLLIGSLEMDGKFSYSWDFDCSKATDTTRSACQSTVQEAGQSGDIDLVMDYDIDYNAETCTTAIIGGTASVSDDSGNVVRASYSGCNQSTVTYNGERLTT